MCNLQRLNKAPAEIARLFKGVLGEVTIGPLGNLPASGPVGETWPGQPGLVLARGKTGAPTLTAMTWGFPYAATGKDGRKLKPRPVNNARADKLDSFLWRDSFAKRRCLIPLTAFAEAEGEAGAKTRTWFSLPSSNSAHPERVEGSDLFCAAGLWRQTDEWGLAYTMVMTEACVHVADVHDRMPVLLAPEDWTAWLDRPADAAEALCVPWAGDMAVERTLEGWVTR